MHLALMWAAASASTSLAQIEALLRNEGPISVLEKYFDCGPQGTPNFEQVAQGNVTWLKIAATLTSEAQGCQLQLLQDSLSRAIVAAPAEFLALVESSSKLGTKRICVPFLSEDEPREVHLEQLIENYVSHDNR